MNYTFDPDDELSRMTDAVLDAIYDQGIRMDPHGPKVNARELALRVREASQAHRLLAHAIKHVGLLESENAILKDLLAAAERRIEALQTLLEGATAALEEKAADSRTIQ